MGTEAIGHKENKHMCKWTTRQVSQLSLSFIKLEALILSMQCKLDVISICET